MIVHYLDDLRHALAVMWAYTAWAGNVSGEIIIWLFGAVIVTLIWPRARKILARLLGEAIHAHIAPHLAALHDHIEQATGVKHDPNRNAN